MIKKLIIVLSLLFLHTKAYALITCPSPAGWDVIVEPICKDIKSCVISETCECPFKNNTYDDEEFYKGCSSVPQMYDKYCNTPPGWDVVIEPKCQYEEKCSVYRICECPPFENIDSHEVCRSKVRLSETSNYQDTINTSDITGIANTGESKDVGCSYTASCEPLFTTFILCPFFIIGVFYVLIMRRYNGTK